jgi:hypothetical protein
LVEDVPSLPNWIMKTVEKGEDEKALKYVDYLNSDTSSPWYNKIEMANLDNDEASVSQKTFVKAIKKYVLVANNPVTINTEDTQHRIFVNYWTAITKIIGTVEPAVLFKYNGVELFCKFSIPFFGKMINMPDFKVATMQSVLQLTFDNMEGDYAGVGHTAFWVKGGKASFLNSGAINVISNDMVKALHKSNEQKEIDL